MAAHLDGTKIYNACIAAKHEGHAPFFTYGAHIWFIVPASGSWPWTDAQYAGACTIYRDTPGSGVSYSASTLIACLGLIGADYEDVASSDGRRYPDILKYVPGY